MLTKEDFRAAALEKTRTVDIRSFVKPARDRRPVLRDLLLPDAVKGGERAYALLREAIRETGLVGIATIVLRDAQHLAALEVIDDAMVLTLMRYAEELVDVSEFTFPRAELRKPELQMARTLVEQFADNWDPIAVHRRVPRQPDEDHQGQDEGQGSQARSSTSSRGRRKWST